MIDANDIKELNQLHPRKQRVACLRTGAVAIVHSPYFVLELPAESVKVQDWQHEPYAGVQHWRRDFAAQTPGEPAQVMRVNWEDDGEVVQLLSENIECFMRPAFYDFFIGVLTDPSFLLHPGEGHPNISVLDGGELVGVLTQLLQ